MLRWFQSSSGQKAGCNLLREYNTETFMWFQSSSGQKAGCNARCAVPALRLVCFNPHPARRPDATGSVGYLKALMPKVSILIRPEGRMQLGGSADFLYFGRVLFQSSSGQKAGCNIIIRSQPGCCSCFNPHPARRPDATLNLHREACILIGFQSSSGQKAGCNTVSVLDGESVVVQFQSSSGQKAGCNPAATGHQYCSQPAVSILIRPEGRMQPTSPTEHSSAGGCFNPHPARRPDATVRLRRGFGCHIGVSILIRPEGRMQRSSCPILSASLISVSILIRPEGRMQPVTVGVCAPANVFQSSSGLLAGCNFATHWFRLCSSWFQSSSGQKAGCNPGLRDRPQQSLQGFNPHPARRPDATEA